MNAAFSSGRRRTSHSHRRGAACSFREREGRMSRDEGKKAAWESGVPVNDVIRKAEEEARKWFC